MRVLTVLVWSRAGGLDFCCTAALLGQLLLAFLLLALWRREHLRRGGITVMASAWYSQQHTAPAHSWHAQWNWVAAAAGEGTHAGSPGAALLCSFAKPAACLVHEFEEAAGVGARLHHCR